MVLGCCGAGAACNAFEHRLLPELRLLSEVTGWCSVVEHATDAAAAGFGVLWDVFVVAFIQHCQGTKKDLVGWRVFCVCQSFPQRLCAKHGMQQAVWLLSVMDRYAHPLAAGAQLVAWSGLPFGRFASGGGGASNNIYILAAVRLPERGPLRLCATHGMQQVVRRALTSCVKEK